VIINIKTTIKFIPGRHTKGTENARQEEELSTS